jgi:hypothetical protein
MFITEIDEMIVQKFNFLVEEYHFEGPCHDETYGPYLQSEFSYRNKGGRFLRLHSTSLHLRCPGPMAVIGSGRSESLCNRGNGCGEIPA